MLMNNLTTTAVFIGLCCLLVNHVHSISFAELVHKSSSGLAKVVSGAKAAHQKALEEAERTYQELKAKADTELAKVMHFSTAERVFGELNAKIEKGDELEKWVKKMKDRFGKAKAALKANVNDVKAERNLEEAAKHLTDFDASCKAAEKLLKNTNADQWMGKTLTEIQDAEYVAEQAVKTAKKEHSAAESAAKNRPNRQSKALAEIKEREFLREKQKFAHLQRVRDAKEKFDKLTQELVVQDPVSNKEKMTSYKTGLNPKWSESMAVAKEDAKNARDQLVKEVNGLMRLIWYYVR